MDLLLLWNKVCVWARNYVSCIVSKKKRSLWAQIRGSGLSLHMEKGSYVDIVKDRICIFCDLQDVENEMHHFHILTIFISLESWKSIILFKTVQCSCIKGVRYNVKCITESVLRKGEECKTNRRGKWRERRRPGNKEERRIPPAVRRTTSRHKTSRNNTPHHVQVGG